MSEVFGPVYADSYDALYQDKDYEGECDLIERLFKTYRDEPVQSVIDMGCGTGGHAIRLAERGYEVVGIDASASMLDQARRKAHLSATPDRVLFHQGDISKIDLERTFDAALMMFAVLGYLPDDDAARAALGTARRHLQLGGLLIFDLWYGPAVLQQGPSPRVKKVASATGEIVRTADGVLDEASQTCAVRYQVSQHERGCETTFIEESHTMRYFFPFELKGLLAGAGFTPIRLGKFPKFDEDPDESSWNMLCAARAI